MRKATLIPAILLLCVAANAQTTVQRFLVPVYSETFGANGSHWVPELRLMNAGTTPAAINNLTDFSGLEPIVPPTLIPGASLNASQAILDVPGGTGIQGALLFVNSDVAGQFAFQLRVRDISQDAARWGVAIPVVPEAQATLQPVDLLNIPIDSRYRQMLRVYSFDRVPGSEVRVRVYGTSTQSLRIPNTPDSLLAETVIPLTLAVTASQPSYAELANLAGMPGVAAYDEIRIRVEPLQVTHLWAMVSVTNNTTQEVTIITPTVH